MRYEYEFWLELTGKIAGYLLGIDEGFQKILSWPLKRELEQLQSGRERKYLKIEFYGEDGYSKTKIYCQNK